MTNKTIVILSYYYHPQITPRAFRAKELATEFIKRGWNVILITPLGVFNNDQILTLHTSTVAPPKPQISHAQTAPIKSLAMKLLRRILPGGKDLLGSLKLIRHGTKTKTNATIVMSIGLPFSVHLATYFLKLTGFLRSNRFMADYGDPYSAMEARYKGCLYAKTIERQVLKAFDEITVPVVTAKVEFESVTDLNKIYISPQGLDISQFRIANYEAHPNKSRFAYAGLFYSDIRNPSVLFDYLKTLSKDVEFHLYTRASHEATQAILKRYSASTNIIIHNSISREECIFELSKYDFLINIENEIESQTPSKLIDYTIAGRPIFSFKPSTFNQTKLDAFLQKNYESRLVLDISKFNIITVTDKLITGQDCI